MPPRQNTFTLVPNPLGMQGLMSRPTTGPESKPPMTSKQAQKLYKQATRQPRLSKAEQRRIELEEQARIRKELDKEKQANKARILREKKKAKEQQILEEKRRKGLPLVDVRPSQDTIARFVRGNGMGKKRDATGAKVGLPTVQEEESDKVPPREAEEADGSGSKRPRLDDASPSKNNREDRADTPEVPPPEPLDIPTKTAEPPKTRTPAAQRSEQCRFASPSTDSIPIRREATGEERTEILTTGEKTRAEGKPGSEEPEGHDARTVPSDNTRDGKPTTDVTRGHVKVHEVNKDTMAEETPTRAPSHPPIRQDTPDQGVSSRDKFTPGAHERKPNEPPVTKDPRPQPPTTARPPIPHPQRNPSPKPQLAQHPAARKPLQDATNALNRTARPLPAGDKASKFASPYKQPAFSTPRQQTPRAAPAFKQSKPQTPNLGAPKPQFLPPHLRQRTPSAAFPNNHKKASDDFMTAPPTSTQLFVMSHIDDLFPSPSQEARELSGDPPLAMAKSPQPAPVRPPIAAARPARQLTRQTAHISSPMAPPPRPPIAKPMAKAMVEPTAEVPTDIPFISTQDLILSSQDLRDVEAPTPSRATGTRGTIIPPFKKDRPAEQLRPSPSSHSLSHAAVTPQAPGKQPTPAAKQRLNPPNPSRRPAQVCQQDSCASRQSAAHKSQPATQRSRSAFSPCPSTVREGNAPPRPPSPEKPRFFGSSGDGVEMLLALERSRRTHQEEEKRRLADRAAQPSPVRAEPAANGHQPAGVQRPKAREEQGQPSRPQPGPLQTASSGSGKPTAKAVTEGQPDAAIKTASQETDYGDIELDSIDFDELTRICEDRPSASQESFEEDELSQYDDDEPLDSQEAFLEMLHQYMMDLEEAEAMEGYFGGF